MNAVHERHKTKIVVMQVTETVSDGLKREFKVVVPAADLDTQGRRAARRAQGPGPHQRLPARQGAGRASASACTAARSWPRRSRPRCARPTRKIVTERGVKLAREPKVTLPNEQGAVEQVIEGKADLAYTVAIEILPTIELADFKGIELERLSRRGRRRRGRRGARAASPSRTGRSRPRARAPRPRTATASPSTSPARSTASRSRAAPASDVAVDIGSGTFIPGFEEQLDRRRGRRDSAPSR